MVRPRIQSRTFAALAVAGLAIALVTGAMSQSVRVPRTATLIYDGQCGFCRRCARSAKRVLGPRLALLDVHRHGAVRRLGVDPHGALERVMLWWPWGTRSGYEAIAMLGCMRSRWACAAMTNWPARLLGRAVYAVVSPNRHAVSRALGWEAPSRSLPQESA
jgi:hypothetical protein